MRLMVEARDNVMSAGNAQPRGKPNGNRSQWTKARSQPPAKAAKAAKKPAKRPAKTRSQAKMRGKGNKQPVRRNMEPQARTEKVFT